MGLQVACIYIYIYIVKGLTDDINPAFGKTLIYVYIHVYICIQGHQYLSSTHNGN